MSENRKPVLEWDNSDVRKWLQSINIGSDVFGRLEDLIPDGKVLLTCSKEELYKVFGTPLVLMQSFPGLKQFELAQRQLQLENLESFITLGYDPFSYLKYIPPNLISSKLENDKSSQLGCYCHSFCQKCASNSPFSSWSESGCFLSRNVDNDNRTDQGPDGAYRSEQENQRCAGRVQGDGSELDPPGGAILQGHAPTVQHSGGHPGLATKLPPEVWKAVIAMAYLFVVTWITAFVMVIVHDRVPDMKKYPPLPDIFLDNVPHIPWAFNMCEVTGTILLIIWIGVLLFHKHRFILLRRFFALSGTVFLLRCVTMLITSLSVPGSHLQCNPRTPVFGNETQPYGDIWAKAHQAYLIWKGAGMSIQGVRTCGDYMFSGHTVALTMLNFFITEYTPRYLYFIHTFTWLLNMFGIFFILSAHEHYSIDVFVAFYITSRLFLYYHTLASHHRSLMRRDTGRARIWFPLLAFFEASVDGTVPNEYEWPTLSALLPGVPVNAIKRKVMHVIGKCLSWKNIVVSPATTPARQPPDPAIYHPEGKSAKHDKVS